MPAPLSRREKAEALKKKHAPNCVTTLLQNVADANSRCMASCKSVEAPAHEGIANFVPPVYQKSAGAEAIITKALDNNILMKELDPSDRVVTLAPL